MIVTIWACKNLRKPFIWILLISIHVWAGCCCAMIEQRLLNGFELQQFQPAGPMVVYNRLNLFEYINGEAEVYLPSGFKILYVQSYLKIKTGIRMIVETYDMGTSEGARAIYARYTKTGGAFIENIGESAWIDKYIVLFRWRNYFFRVLADPSPDPTLHPTLQDMAALSRAIHSALFID